MNVIVNVRTCDISKIPNFMYCGWSNARRGLETSPLANPYTHTGGRSSRIKVATRNEAIVRYKDWLWGEIKGGNREILTELRGITDDTVLGCWCAPLPCHCEVISSARVWLQRDAYLTMPQQECVSCKSVLLKAEIGPDGICDPCRYGALEKGCLDYIQSESDKNVDYAQIECSTCLDAGCDECVSEEEAAYFSEPITFISTVKCDHCFDGCWKCEGGYVEKQSEMTQAQYDASY